MNRERGFRRVVFALSLLGLCVGIGLTAHSWYRTQLFLAVGQEQRWCAGEKPTPDTWEKCSQNTAPLPAHIVALLKIALNNSRIRWALDLGSLFDSAADVVSVPIEEIDRLGRFVLILGAVATVGLTLLPWTVFYVCRWIVRGFYDPKRT